MKKQQKKMKAQSLIHKIVSFLIFIICVAFVIGIFLLSYFVAPDVFSTKYVSSEVKEVSEGEFQVAIVDENIFLPIHIETPDAVRAIYMTQCVVGTPSFRKDLVEIADTTEINSIIIDIKDYTGKIAFQTDNPMLKDSVSDKCGAYDMREFISLLHSKGIYVIGRITVFQDPYYTNTYPEFAIKKASATTTLWEDYKGLSFVDVGAKPFWDYIIEISKESFDLGFDELNFDYIRFPSDGNMQDIYYPFSEDRVTKNVDTGKAEGVELFFRYLSKNLKEYKIDSYEKDGVTVTTSSPVLSADLFGMVTTNKDDLNIGQQLERALPYFDYIAPMTYPSHYPKGFNGWSNPNDHVYGVLKFSMDSAVERLLATTTTVKTLQNGASLSTTTKIYKQTPYNKLKLRPWLQDFDYGGDYDVEEVRAQIQATYDAGLNSWMLWAPSNRYTIGALESAKNPASTSTTSTAI